MHDNRAEYLASNITRLGPHDQASAKSLLSQLAKKHALTDKQWAFVNSLADRASGVTLPPSEAIGNVTPIVTMMQKAATHLKRPALLISTTGPDTLRITIAGSGSRRYGDIAVSVSKHDETGRRPWIGWIGKDNGRFDPSPKLTPNAVANVTQALRAFAADPVGVAARYGKMTGRCCFCSLRLTDSRSVSVGYGATCAKNYDLPWGE